MLGLGYEYNWSKKLATRVEYNWINNVGGHSTGGSDISTISIGVTYKLFGSDSYVPIVPVIIEKEKFKKLSSDHPDEMTVYFNTNSYSLTLDEINKVDILLTYLTENKDINVYLHGYTDNTYTEEYNYELSKNRAKSIFNYMVYRGVNKGRFELSAFGLENPVMSNDTKEGRKLNRRVEIYLIQE